MSEYDAEELAAQLQSENSRENIKKRRSQRARRRRMALLKGIFRLICTIFLLAAIGIAGYYIVGWGVQAYRDVRDMYEAYLIRQEANRGEVDVRFDGYTNVLVLGLDDAVNMDNAEEQRADAILLISMENATGKVRILNIPRDTWVQMAQGKGETRLANVYAVGGAPLMVRTINQMFDISIHQYVVIDLATFGQIVDAVGGIDLYIERNMDYDDPEAGLSIHMRQGYRHLDGVGAEHYLRYRSDDLGDLGRTQRQQKFVKAFYAKLLRVDTLPKVPAIADILKQNVTTSAELFDSVHIGNVIRKLNIEPPRTIMLPGDFSRDDDTVWIMDRAATDEIIHELFPPETTGAE
ncbi:LytR family transcriptional regulator [Selenomonas sp. oral taxon 126]|uniref:LCP family protein n=1 Tax=Selenomonas sp. oral taxon 126 TaxID=712528 RepID=UPI0008078140|nr:LCP family protein [Selenomonas sp. oral taxon 126]ANR71508.1 LytR family transcriptional regulator [Selenomonas sp. oral taxon 126]